MANYHIDGLGEEHRKSLQSILNRSAIDEDFRKKLIEDPHAAVTEEAGLNVPEGFEVKFVENDADMTLVLPDFAEELDEEALEDVAGGSCGWVDACGSDVEVTGTITVTVNTGGEDPVQTING